MSINPSSPKLSTLVMPNALAPIVPTAPVAKSATASIVKEEEFFLGWHGHEVAKLGFNGVAWSFNYNNGWVLPLSGGHYEHPGQLPTFVSNLMPETMHGTANGFVKLEEVLRKSERFLSNIVICKDAQRIHELPFDRLSGRLSDCSENTVFMGVNQNMPALDQTFISKMNDLVVSSHVPRMSGCQAKLPCNLSRDYILAPAVHTAFSHILKFPGLANDPHLARGVVEWLSMSLAKAGGVNTCEFSLVEMHTNVLAYVAERFDVPVDAQDKRLFFCEDFCSAMGNTPGGKYIESLESMIETLLRVSTEPEEDALAFFKLIYANKVLENGDFHLKNAAILREVKPSLNGFVSTRLAPAFDIMNTRYFNPKPRPIHMPEKMALEFQGSNQNYSMKHLLAIGQSLGLSPSDAMDTMFSVASGITAKVRDISENLPELFNRPEHKVAQAHVAHACLRALDFCRQDFPELEQDASLKSVVRP